MTTIPIKCKDIAINAIIDGEDFETLRTFNWHLTRDGYAQANINSGANRDSNGRWKSMSDSPRRRVLMHRLVADAPKGKQVDHINKNRLDNRKSNLRICTADENRSYRIMRGSHGIGIHQIGDKWLAFIRPRMGVIYHAIFNTYAEALISYNAEKVKRAA